MKRTLKVKKGFTLVEMVLVIAIIVIIAAALVTAIGKYNTYANTAKSVLKSHNEETSEAAKEVANNI